jgi:uncharacterized repeat protein (TIGR01451 family)
VAISGDTVVVGARLEQSNATGVDGNQADNSASQSGAAYVFVRSGSTWSQEAYLKASNTGADDQFGASVAISGDTAVVGARSEASNATGVNGNQADNSAVGSGAAYVFAVPGPPDLSLTKSDGGAAVSPGGTVSYTLSYSNTSVTGAAGVTLVETVPANTTFNAGVSTAGWSCAPDNNAGSSCTLAVGSVAAAAGGSATFAVTVANLLPAGVTQISNSATIGDDGANGTDPTPGNNTGSDTTPVTGAPDLSVTKSDGGASVAPGGTVSYTLSYSNTGNRGASGVVLTETVPTNTTFNAGASTAGWSCVPDNNAGSTCTLAVGSVAAAAGGSATFAVTVANPLPPGVTQISNTATIGDDAANGTDPTPGNNSGSDTTPVTGAPDLSVTKSDGGASVAPGGTVSYALSYSNTGNRGASGVVLTETVPANTTFNAGASTAGWSCVPDNNAGSTCTLAVGSVAAAAGGSATFAVTVANPLPPGVTQISNTATIGDDGANGTDPTPGNNTGSDSTPLLAGASVSATKTASAGPFLVGDLVTYTIILTNAGPGAQGDNPGDELLDVLPASLALVSASATSGSVFANLATNTVTWNGALPAAGSVTITIQATILPAAAGTTVVNQGDVLYDGDANGTNESAASTDDPGAGGSADATAIQVSGGSVIEIPTLDDAGLLLLVLGIAGLSLARLRRLRGAQV